MAYLEQLGEQYGRTLARTFSAARVPLGAPAKTPAQVGKDVGNQVRRAPRRPRTFRPVTANPNVIAGAMVRYRQGRGTFDAEVIRVDEVTRMATLQRTADGKRVLRPLDRVYT